MAYVNYGKTSGYWNDDEDQVSNNPYTSIANYQNRMEQVGLEPPAPKRNGMANFAMTALDVVDRPRKMIANTLNELLNPNAYQGGVGTALWEGFTGKRTTGFGEVMDNLGYKSDPTKQWWQGPDNLARSTVGFVGDVLMDPLTYASFGAVPVLKKIGKEGLEAALKKALGSSADNLAGKADDVMRQYLSTDALAKYDAGGIGALNADDFAQMKQAAHMDQGTALADAKSAKDSFNKQFGQLFGLTSKNNPTLKKVASSMGMDQKETFMQRIQDVLEGRVDVEDFANKHADDMQGNIANGVDGARTLDPAFGNDSLVAGIYNVLTETLGDPHKLVDGVRQYDNAAAQAYHQKALEIAQRLQPDPGGPVKGLTSLWEKVESMHSVRNAAGEVEHTLKMANGLEKVYNEAQKRTFFKFAGKPLFEVTGAIAKGQQLLDSAVMSNRFTRELSNTIGRAFDTQHVDLNLKKHYPEVYEALKSKVVPLINQYSRKSSAIPPETLKYAHHLFDPEFLKNERLRKALVYYVEGGEQLTEGAKYTLKEGADKWAQKEFLKLQATLSEADHQMLVKAATAVQMATDAMHNVERTIWEGLSATKQDKIAYEALEKNYIPRVYRKDDNMIASATTLKDQKTAMQQTNSMKIGASNSRTFKSVAQAKNAGGKDPVEDIVALMGHRKLQHSKFTTAHDFHRDLANIMKDNPELKGVLSTKRDPHMLQFGDTGLYVSPYIAEQFNRLSEITNQSLGARGLLRIFDETTNILKTLQTNMNPAFVVKNLIGESMMTVADGVTDVNMFKLAHDLATNADLQRFSFDDRMFYFDGKLVFARKGNTDEIIMGGDFGANRNLGDSTVHMRDPATGKYPEAASTMRMPAETFRKTRQSFKEMANQWIIDEVHAGRLGKEHLVDINGRTYSKAYLWHQFMQEGLYQHGMAKGNMIQSIDAEVAAQFSNKNLAQKALHAMPAAADYGESVARFAHFADRLNKGDSFGEAAQRVRDWHVDYKDLTPVERGFMRRVMPYYTYMRKNTPMQFKHLVTDPGMYATVFKLIRNSTEALYAQGGASPDYLMQSMAIPLGTDENGNTLYLNANLPLTDLNRLQYDVGEGFSKNVLDMLHPAIKSTFELGMNQSMSFDTPVEKYEGQSAPLIPGIEEGVRIPKKMDYMLQQTGILQSLRKTLGAGVAAGMGVEEDPARPRYSDNPLLNAGGTLMSSMLPLKNQEATQLQNAYQYRDELQAHAKMLKEEHGIVLPSANTKSKGRTYVKFPVQH